MLSHGHICSAKKKMNSLGVFVLPYSSLVSKSNMLTVKENTAQDKLLLSSVLILL